MLAAQLKRLEKARRYFIAIQIYRTTGSACNGLCWASLYVSSRKNAEDLGFYYCISSKVNV